MAVLRGFAETVPDRLIARMRSDERKHYTLFWCLGWASDEESIDVLLAGCDDGARAPSPSGWLAAADSPGRC